MAEKKTDSFAPARPDSLEEQEKRDALDQLELMGEARGVLRRGGVILAAFIVLIGWYLSREWGIWFLIGGAIRGVIVGGGLVFSGSLTSVIIKKYVNSQKDNGKTP